MLRFHLHAAVECRAEGPVDSEAGGGATHPEQRLLSLVAAFRGTFDPADE